jgi:hypothetical protein
MNASHFEPDGADRPRRDALITLNRLVPAGETLRAALQSHRFEDGIHTFRLGHVLITSKAIYAAKDRLFGSPKLNVRVPLDGVSRTGVGPLYGVGPTWQVAFQGRQSGFFYVSNGRDAETIGEILGRSIGAMTDPDLDQLNRSIDAARQAPPGNKGKSLTSQRVSVESREIRARIEAGDLQGGWDRRVVLGYGLPLTDIPQVDQFWIDAAPAIAALKLGLKDHPMVAMCCGLAEQNADLGDPEQASAVAEFHRLYFQT